MEKMTEGGQHMCATTHRNDQCPSSPLNTDAHHCPRYPSAESRTQSGVRRARIQLRNHSVASAVSTTQGTKACVYTLRKATLCHRTRAQEWGKACGLALSTHAQGMLEGNAAGETTPQVLSEKALMTARLGAVYRACTRLG